MSKGLIPCIVCNELIECPLELHATNEIGRGFTIGHVSPGTYYDHMNTEHPGVLKSKRKSQIPLVDRT